jgi:hypothetical protein
MIYEPEETQLKFLEGQELIQVAVGLNDLQLGFESSRVSVGGDISLNEGRCNFQAAGSRLVGVLGERVKQVKVDGDSNIMIEMAKGLVFKIHGEKDGFESATIEGPQGLLVY